MYRIETSEGEVRASTALLAEAVAGLLAAHREGGDDAVTRGPAPAFPRVDAALGTFAA